MSVTIAIAGSGASQGTETTKAIYRLLSPGGPTTSVEFAVGQEPVFLQAFGLEVPDDIQIDMVGGDPSAPIYSPFKPAGGRTLRLNAYLNSVVMLYPGRYRLRRITGASGATVFGYAASVSHEFNSYYATAGSEAAPPYAVEAGYAGNAGGMAYQNPDGSLVGGASINNLGIVQFGAQPIDDQGGSRHQPAEIQVSASTAMQSLFLMALPLLEERKYRFRAVLYVTCNSAGGVRADMLCSNASYMVYSTTITHSAGQVFSGNLTSGTATSGTGFTVAKVEMEGFVTMGSDGNLIPRFSQAVSNPSPTSVLVGCDINATERSAY